MSQEQIEFYQSLPEVDKNILRAAALRAENIDERYVQTLLPMGKIRYTQKVIKTVLETAQQQKILVTEQGSYYRSHGPYTVNPEFMIQVLPEISNPHTAWSKITQQKQYYYTESELTRLRDCLVTLIHLPKEYSAYEARFFEASPGPMCVYYSMALRSESYKPYLSRIRPDILLAVFRNIIDENITALIPFDATRQFIQHIQDVCKSKNKDLLIMNELERITSFYQGDFTKALSLFTAEPNQHETCEQLEKQAIAFLTEGKTKEAFALYEKLIKLWHKLGIKSSLSLSASGLFFQLTTLFCVDMELTSPYFQKFYDFLVKNYNAQDPNNWIIPIIRYALDHKRSTYAPLVERLAAKIAQDDISLYSLIHILTVYLSGEKLHREQPPELPRLLDIIHKGYESGCWLLAYEALYAVKSWYDHDADHGSDIDRLWQLLSSRLSYQPVLSRIVKHEDWEKSLAQLLKFKNTPARIKGSESKSRVVYYYNPLTNNVQPMSQTQQSGGWSTGRNIAMKTLREGQVKGMTGQDYRIAKTIRFRNDSYASYHEFTDEVLVALIGHPYIFLHDTKDIPVEFVAAQPTIKITQEGAGYTLSADIDPKEAGVFVRKETNTRYLIYSVTGNQTRILDIINSHHIVVPESGKERLLELLGTFSAEGMAVHSDLLASENTQTAIREITADARIRVQLLPLGDGLKAELFVKPFGDRPPYCKPGKGGKALIAHESDGQLQVKRDFSREQENANLLLADIQGLESLTMTGDLISFADPLDSLYLLDILRRHSDICVVEWPEGERYRLRTTTTDNQLKLHLKSGINWFELEGELRVDERTVLSLQQLLSLSAQSQRRFIELGAGEFLALSDELKRNLDELRLFSSLERGELRLNKFASIALEDLFNDVSDLKADKAWRDFRRRVAANRLVDAAVPVNLRAELRPYQEEGFRWLARLASWEGGACLADDMGLGKTVQALALLQHRAEVGPALVVCPVSVLGNWIGEAQRFTPALNIKTFGAGTEQRKETLRGLGAGDLLVISYGLLQSEEDLLAAHEFATVVLDEAHVIRNSATKTAKAAMRLRGAFRVALTGTPVQNHPGEIWSLFNFINPGLLGSAQQFYDKFIKTSDATTSRHLKKLIAPFVLRRSKTAVLDELPPKTEIAQIVPLSDEEMAFYEALRRQAVENLSDGQPGNASMSAANATTGHIQVLAEITRLRQASCNPRLLDPDIGIASSKMAAFLDIVRELRENRHRALVFSQFVTHLALVRQELDRLGISYQYLDGSTSARTRQERVKKFQNGESDLFLISLKAGGLGLNLTAADYVIHLDPWWNPAVEDQASDRAHRIGQQRPVTIYRLIAAGTIEEKIIQLHHTKRNMVESLLEGADLAAKLSLDELIALIKG